MQKRKLMYKIEYSIANKLLIIFVFISINISPITSSILNDADERYKKAIQYWKQGYDYYSQGDYQKALASFEKSKDNYDFGMICDYNPQDAINHCLYLMGREDEIDTSHTFNDGKYYFELDSLHFVSEEYRKLWRAFDKRDSKKVQIVMSDILRSDTIKGLQDRYTHARKLRYAGERCHWYGMYEDALKYLQPALNLERRLTPVKFRDNLYTLVEKVIDTCLRLGMGDSAMSVALQHFEECQNSPSDTILAKGFPEAENLIIHVLMSLQLYEEAWGEIIFADSVINSHYPQNNHTYGAGWKNQYYNAIGRKDKALIMSKDIHKIYKHFDESSDFLRFNSLTGLINSLKGINDFENAIPLQQEIINLCDTSKNDFIQLYKLKGEQYTQMAYLYMGNYEYEKAKYWINKADSVLSVPNSWNYKILPQYYTNKEYQSLISIATNDDVQYNTAISEMEEIIASDTLKRFSFEPTLYMIKGIYEGMRKNWNRAKDSFLKQLEYNNIDQNTLTNLSKCYYSLGMPDSAYFYVDTAVKDIRNYVEQNLENLSERERELFWDNQSQPFNILCNSIVKSGRVDLVGQLYDDVALFSKGLLLTASSSPDYIERLQINWHGVQRCLKKSEAAVEFIATPHEDVDSSLYVALVLRNNSEQPVMIKLGKGVEIKSAIKDGYTTSALSEIIWSPLKDELKDIKKVWFSVDGILHKIPIEYLPYNKKKNISDIYQLYRLTSTRELVIHNPNLIEENGVLYGDLTYTPSSYNSTSNNDSDEDLVRAASKRPLRYTRDEIKIVSTILKDKGIPCKIYNQDQGTRSSLLALNGLPISYLHLATHGYYYEIDTNKVEKLNIPSLLGFSMSNMSQAEKAMLRSGLVMSDSIVTAYDVSHLSFNDLRLVALSACGSGLGDIGRGEGVFGLQRAFKQAGAQSILMTLWDVDDYMTYCFMEHFYSRIFSGYSMQKALKSAQKMVRNTKVNGVYDFRDPKYWAGYILLDAFN